MQLLIGNVLLKKKKEKNFEKSLGIVSKKKLITGIV